MKPRGLATNETEPSEIQFKNGSDHAVAASYSELYEEGEVEHINSPSHPPCLLEVVVGNYYGVGYVADMATGEKDYAV